MRTHPLVSIVLPTHNGARYIRQSIDSCISQTYQPWELIIVNDGSIDGTQRIAENYVKVDGRIRLVSHAVQRCLPDALNTGFSFAGGEYLTWTSDDNCYRPKAIETMVSFLENEPHIGLVYSDYERIDEHGQEIERRSVGDPTELMYRHVVGGCFLYRREVKDTVGIYSSDAFLAEDYDYWLRVARLWKMRPLHEDLYEYRTHQESLSKRLNFRAQSMSDRVLARNLGALPWGSRREKAERRWTLAKRAFTRGDRTWAVGQAVRSTVRAPDVVARDVCRRIWRVAQVGLRRV